jgi:glycosyltransferase involved in cell wall biosynthesis
MTMTNAKAPEVSIIVPAYNTATLIPACMDSIFTQTYSDFEVIVVNDGSPDTPELEKSLAPYLDRITYIEQENKRAAGARNTAIRCARGRFLAFLDSDDAWLPGHLASQMKMFRQEHALDLVYADALVGDPKHQWRFMNRCHSRGEASFRALVVERCQIPISTVVARRTAIERAGLFDENLLCFDDYDMWLRTAFHGGKIGYSLQVQARLSGKRPGSLSQSVSKMAEAYGSILEKAIRTLPLSKSQRDLIAKRILESRAVYQMVEANLQLRSRQFGRARELFREANRHLRRPEVSFAVHALGVAPRTAAMLIKLSGRIRGHALPAWSVIS